MYEQMMIDKRIELHSWVYNSNFLLYVYIYGDMFSQDMNW